MANRKLPTLGTQPKDVAEDVRKLKGEVAKKATVESYTAAVGSNTVKHGQKSVPAGRHIVWSEVGTLADVSLTSTEWTFTATAAGTVKVIWL